MLAAVSALMLLCSNTAFTDLLVDTLLPLTALSATALVIYYRDDLENKIIYTIPHTVFLIGIKNSGPIFVAFILTYAFFYMERRRASVKKWLIAAAAPVLARCFWNAHVNHAFEQGMMSKHSLSLSYFLEEFVRKTKEEMIGIAKVFWDTVFSFSNHFIYLIILCAIIYLYCCIFSKERQRQSRQTALAVLLFYVIYQIGNFAMYIFSMPAGEALSLGGYSRYHGCILIYLSGLLLLEVFLYTGGQKISSGNIALLLLTFALSSAALSPHLAYYKRQNSENTDRAHYDALIEEHKIRSNASYLIIMDESRNDYGYLKFMTRYLLSSSELLVVPPSQLTRNLAEEYDYVILFDESSEGRSFMAELTDYDGQPVICRYIE